MMSAATGQGQIESISVEDFQSHHRSRVDPAPAGQLTVLVGPTDCGKTAILRALKLLFYNAPQGVDYVRIGAARAVVAVAYADGSQVVRERSRGGVNRYKLIDPAGAEQVFEGFGVGVPLEIQEHAGVGAVEIADLALALNLSEQLDGPFLGSAVSAGARARVLGKLAGTEEIDVAARGLNVDLHRAGQEEKRLAAQVGDLETQVAGYAWVDGLARRVEALQGILEQVHAAQGRLGRLETLAASLTQVEAQAARCRRQVARWRSLDQVQDLAAQVVTGLERGARLVALEGRLAGILVDRAAARRVARRWSHVQEAAARLEAAGAAATRADRLQRLGRALANIAADRTLAQRTVRRHAGVNLTAGVAIQVAMKIDRGRALVALGRRVVAPQIEQARRAVARWRGVDAADRAQAVAGALTGRLVALTLLAARRRMTAEAMTHANNNVTIWAKNLAAELREYSDALVALGRCPTCGQPIPATGIKEVA